MSGFLNQPNNQGQTKNLFLATLLMFGIVFVYTSFITPAPAQLPPPSTDGSGEEVADDGSADTAPDEGSGDVAEPATEVEAVVQVPELPPMRLVGTNHAISISNVGGRVVSVEIIDPEQYKPHDEIFGVFPEEDEAMLPFSLSIGGLPDLTETSHYSVVDAESVQNSDGNWSKITLSWAAPDGAIEVVRTYEPDPERPFGVVSSVEVRNTGSTPRRFEDLEALIHGRFSSEGGGIMQRSASVLEGLCVGEFGTERRPARKIEERRVFGDGPENVDFGGIDERYFMTALIPTEETIFDRCAYRPSGVEEHMVTVMTTPEFSIEPGSSRSFDFLLFTGPKHEEYLDAFPGELARSVDFGWFSFLAIPIRVMLLFFQGLVINWGFAIILLTISIKMLLFPVTQKGYESMEKMKKVGPRMKELQEKYESDRMKLAEEQQKLFKEEGVNPLSGCLPMLAQMPIYFALYRAIWGSAELYNAPFALWIQDLSQADPFFVLPVLMGLTMLIQQRLMPQAVDNPQMKTVNRVMPVMFTVMMLFLPSGLVLYIFVNMVLSIAQMLYIRKKFATDDKPAESGKKKEKSAS